VINEIGQQIKWPSLELHHAPVPEKQPVGSEEFAISEPNDLEGSARVADHQTIISCPDVTQ
jgi:hypothetical protein